MAATFGRALSGSKLLKHSSKLFSSNIFQNENELPFHLTKQTRTQKLRKNDQLGQLLTQPKFYSPNEWDEIKYKAINESNVGEIGFSSYIMKICLNQKNFQTANSLIKYLEYKNEEPNFQTLATFLRLSSSCHEEAGDEIVLKTYEKIKTLDKLVASIMLPCAEALAKTSKWQEILDLIKTYENVGRPPTNIYNSLIECAFRNGQLQLAFSFLDKLKNQNRIASNDVINEWIKICLQEENDNINKLIKYLQEAKIFLPFYLTDRIKEYFDKKNLYRGKFVEIAADGYCPHCKSHLQDVKLSELEFKLLQNKLLQLITSSENKLFKYQSECEWEKFVNFISQSNGGFDVIIDATNIIFYMQRKKLKAKNIFKHVSNLVTHLSEKEGKKILIIGKSQLKTWSDDFDELNKKCSLFLTGNLCKDDVFLMYAAMMSGASALVVSRDLFRNYSYVLANDSSSEYFRIWKCNNQIDYEFEFDDRGIRLLSNNVFNPFVQSNEFSIHLPHRGQLEVKTDIIKKMSKHWLCLCMNK